MTGTRLPPSSPNHPTPSPSRFPSTSTSTPTTAAASTANTAFLYPQAADEDFSFYYSLLQEPLISFPLDTMPSSHKRKKPAAADADADADDDEEGPPGKKRGRPGKEALAHLLTSLVALEDEDRSERDSAGSADHHDMAAATLEAHHRETTGAMLGYFSTLQSHLSDIDDSDSLRAHRSRLAASLALADAAAAAAGPADEPSGSGSHNHHQPQQRRLWVKDRSKAWWDQYNHPDFPEEDFRRAFRMGRATFDMICDELGAAVAKEDTMLRTAIPVPQRVAVCIWRLATGEPLRVVSKRFGLGISTCHKLVLEVCSAIKTVLMPKFLQWPDPAAIDSIKRRFESASGIPNVIGSMYTTHIPIIAPKISVASYFNRRHTERNQKTSYSITVQGLVDPAGVFTDVCIGWPGSMPDDQVLEKSALYHRAGSGSLEDQWVVGGPSYPLMDWVLVPYAQQNLTWTQHAFNEKISEVQRVARDAFARLKGRWKCLQKRTEVKLQDLPVVLGACCVLHNVCEMRNEGMDEDFRFDLVDDEMVPDEPVRSAGAKKARDNIAHMLLHRGLAGTAFFQ